MKQFALIGSILFGTLFAPGLVFAYQSPGQPTGFVNDFAQVLSVEEKATLESKFSAFNASTTNEIAVVTIESLGGDTIENYANKLFAEWQIGKAKEDNGVLLLVALEDREVRIEVGYGLEGAIPDAIASQIIRNIITPRFKEGNYYAGINGAVVALMSASEGEYAPSSASVPEAGGFWQFVFGHLAVVFILISLVLQWVGAILGRSKSWWAGGVIGGVAGFVIQYMFSSSFFSGGVVIAVLVFLGLIFDYSVSTHYQSAVAGGRRPMWWAGGGGSGGGSSSSGGSFGGFGGGSSGGGGASGRW